ncbi:MAG: HAD-IA family hydrolase [Pseudomonadota bacterium]
MLVILDCDGVLVDSEPITNRLVAEEMTAHGLPLTTEQAIEMFVGGTIRTVFERGRAAGATLPDGWVEYFYDKMIGALDAEITAIAGIHQALDALDGAGYRTCVASNGPMRKMQATLAKTGLWDRLEGRIYSAHEVGVAKPDPGLFLHAASAQGATPGQCVVVEDSASGARAAQAASIPYLGYTGDTPAEKLTAHGAIPFEDMSQMPGLVAKVFSRAG